MIAPVALALLLVAAEPTPAPSPKLTLVVWPKGARIWGGMDFRTALNHGAQLGTSTARWVAKHHFRPTGD